MSKNCKIETLLSVIVKAGHLIRTDCPPMVTVLPLDPKSLSIGTGAYPDRSVEDPAEIQHILIP